MAKDAGSASELPSMTAEAETLTVADGQEIRSALERYLRENSVEGAEHLLRGTGDRATIDVDADGDLHVGIWQVASRDGQWVAEHYWPLSKGTAVLFKARLAKTDGRWCVERIDHMRMRLGPLP